MEEAKRWIGEDTLYNSFDKSMVIQFVYEFKKHLKNKNIVESKKTLNYIKDEIKKDNYISKEPVQKLEDRLEKSERWLREKNDIEEEGEEEDQ
ncbi:hypothetical protein KAH94_00600 [bacterium]|nr:hypothetical protein [bacterium]